MSIATAVRRTGYGLATVLGLARRGYFIPFRHAARTPKPGAVEPYAGLEAWLRAESGRFAGLIEDMDHYAEALLAIGERPAPEPRWRQDWFPGLDGAAAYVLTRRLQPRRIVEIGSGHSTRFFVRAVRDGGLGTAITAIDPAPRATLADLPVTRVPKLIQDAPPEIFGTLRSGDFLVVDSSHVVMPGSDVDFIVARILPRLPAGVYVHFHDIFLPDDYPPDWAWRGYNEQQLVAALLAGGGFEPVFASHYVRTRMMPLVIDSLPAVLPVPAGGWETSLWLRRTAPPLLPYEGGADA